MSNSKKKKGPKTITMQMVSTALRDVLPKQEEKDARSTKLKNLLKKIPLIPFQKLEKWKDAVFELGRAEGFDDMIIGKWIRKAMLEAEYSERTIQRMLPDTAKHIEHQTKQRYQELEPDKMSGYDEAVTPDTVIGTAPPIEQQGQPPEDEAPTGYYQIPLEEFKIEDVEQYDRLFLIKVVQHLYKQVQELQKETGK